jgi:hypothetical protein
MLSEPVHLCTQQKGNNHVTPHESSQLPSGFYRRCRERGVALLAYINHRPGG